MHRRQELGAGRRADRISPPPLTSVITEFGSEPTSVESHDSLDSLAKKQRKRAEPGGARHPTFLFQGTIHPPDSLSKFCSEWNLVLETGIGQHAWDTSKVPSVALWSSQEAEGLRFCSDSVLPLMGP